MIRLLLGFSLTSCLCAVVVFAQDQTLAQKSQRAREAMEQGRFSEAVQLYSQLVREVPGEPRMIMNLALALHSAGDYERATRQLRTVTQMDPRSGAAWFFLGLDSLKLGRTSAAVDALVKAVDLDPVNKMALAELGGALLLVDRAKEAAEYFQRLAALDASDPKAWQGLGLSYAALSQNAFAVLDKIAAESAYVFELLGHSRLNERKYRSAFYFFRRALERNSQLRGVHSALAEIYQATDHPAWAELERERERRLQPVDCAAEPLACAFEQRQFDKIVNQTRGAATAEALYWQARAYTELSAEAFGRLAMLPPSVEIHELLAKAYRIQNLHDRSVAEWQEALKFAPADTRLQKELATSYFLNQDYASAHPLLERLLHLESRSGELNLLMGETLLSMQRPSDALKHLEAAERLSVDQSRAHAALGRVYMALDLPDKAIAQLKQVAANDRDGTLHYQLAKAYSATGKTALAAEELKLYQRLAASAAERHAKLNEEYQITAP
ncbi:MAG TPA: tetratricopeptide repeat protein [Acidobacteriota bacterium]|jgi:predicted Zn-dependent protease